MMENPLVLKFAKQIFMEWAMSNNAPFDKILHQVLSDARAGSSERKECGDILYKLIRFLPMFEVLPFKPQDPAWGRALIDALRRCSELSDSDLRNWHTQAKPTFEKNPIQHLEKIHGVPRFILNTLNDAQIEPFHETLHSLMAEAPISLRCNTLKSNPANLAAELRLLGIAPSRWLTESLHLTRRQNLQKNLAFQDGLFEIQDEHSQLVALLCDVQPDHKVLDLCAGAGGKTLHMAALMQGRGEIWATDLSAGKIQNLRIRARRAEANNVRTFEVHKSPSLKFDRILVDAPCSSLGTLRRNPDRLYKVNEKEVRSLQMVQRELLVRAVSLLKPGGRIAYSTCSFLPAENQNQIASLIDLNPQLKAVDLRQQLLASKHLLQGDTFLTEAKKTPAFELFSNDRTYRSEFLQMGPSQTSGGLVGDGFFVSLVELS